MKKRKKAQQAGVEPKTYDVQGQRLTIIAPRNHCQIVKLIAQYLTFFVHEILPVDAV